MQETDEELRRWAKQAFHPARMRGDVRAIRVEALKRQRSTGFHLTGVEWVILGASAAGIAFLGARWLSRRVRRKAPPSPRSSYLFSADLLVAAA